MASLIELVAGRTHLLARAAGSAIGLSGNPDEPRQRQTAEFLIKAGADPELTPMACGRSPICRSYRHSLTEIGRRLGSAR
jgi:hypothetical protein